MKRPERTRWARRKALDEQSSPKLLHLFKSSVKATGPPVVIQRVLVKKVGNLAFLTDVKRFTYGRPMSGTGTPSKRDHSTNEAFCPEKRWPTRSSSPDYRGWGLSESDDDLGETTSGRHTGGPETWRIPDG